MKAFVLDTLAIIRPAFMPFHNCHVDPAVGDHTLSLRVCKMQLGEGFYRHVSYAGERRTRWFGLLLRAPQSGEKA